MANRSYQDGCAAAHALDLIGERWALLVVRELLFGPKRFTDLRAGLPGASPNVLAQRLRELDEAGVLRRHRLLPPAAATVYELTPWGRQLEPVIIALGRWGGRSPSLLHDARMSADSVALALRTSFSAELARGLSAELGLRMHEDVYVVQVAGDVIRIRRGEAEHPDAVIAAEVGVMNDVIWNDLSIEDAMNAGELSITGDPELVERFVRLFPLPEPADVAARTMR
ncbi:winged helix-turn-helix transcriptional regulator [Agromyces salentinus]|uniref:Winged helix-turn-helix transcriptional regulator n=1 Tax=Agromyces salentinus TaxID=269421 RepID=A0ABN2MK93_9MICO|nr:winged helix-turn-helix transcriptional regulator [Agromyces salentinus]